MQWNGARRQPGQHYHLLMLLLRQGSARDCTEYSLSGALKWALRSPSNIDNSRSTLVSDSDI